MNALDVVNQHGSEISGPQGIAIWLFMASLFAVAFIGMMQLVDKAVANVVAKFKARRKVEVRVSWDDAGLVDSMLEAKKQITDLGLSVRKMELTPEGGCIEVEIMATEPEPQWMTERQRAWFWFCGWQQHRVKYLDSAHYIRERSRLGFLKASRRLNEGAHAIPMDGRAS